MANTVSFDEQFYLQSNPDVAAAVSRGLIASGQAHYNANGRFEGRNPNAFFNTSFYLGQYPDVARAGVNPLTHFLTFGVNENRATNSTELNAFDTDGNGFVNEFNATLYLQNNQDVARAVTAGTFTSAYQHFVQFGQFEGRAAPLTNGTSVTGPFSNTGTVPGTGTTFTLTTGVDALTGTSANDTFVGTFDGGATSTSTLGDSINGGSGIDTVRIISNAANTLVPTLTNVENLVLVDTVHETRDVSGIAGLTSLTLESGTTNGAAGADIVITLAANQTLTLNGVKDGGGTATDVANQEGIDIASAAAVTSLNLNVQNAGAAGNADLDLDVLGTGVATLNIGSIDTNVISLANAGGALRTVNITGAGATTITALPTTITSVNASTATGAVNVNATGVAAASFAFTGGSANDTLTLGDNQLGTIAAGSQLNGGAGVDKIGIFDTALTGAETAVLNGATNFEVLGLNANITLDASTLTSLKSFSIDTAATTSTINNVQTGSTVAFTANTTSLTLAPSVGLNSVDVSLAGGITVGTLNHAGIQTLNVASNGTTANVITALGNSDNANINITGAQALTVSLAAGTAAGSLVNGTAATGNLTVNGSGFNDIIRGGSAVDTINGGAGADKLTGGAGNDVFAFTSAAQTKGAGYAGTNTTNANIDHITDFVGNGAAAGDTIQFSGTANVFGTALDFGTGTTATVTARTVATAADFTALTAAVEASGAGVASADGTAQIYDVTVTSGNLAGRYLILNDDTAAIAVTDTIINITGVTGALNGQDFTFTA